MAFQDHFSSQAAAYASARPSYPEALFDWLVELAPGRHLVWDAGSGNGQAAVELASRFERVIATEPSEAQLAHAASHPRVQYQRAAEHVPFIAAQSVDLMTVAQAAHWFDLSAYYAEVRRVGRPSAVVAIWTYALCQIQPDIDAVVHHFYQDVVGEYWPAGRSHCLSGYRELAFPFDEIAFPALFMQREWSLDDFVRYLGTWSAVARYQSARGQDPTLLIRERLAPLWGAPDLRSVVWPLAGRVGRLPG